MITIIITLRNSTTEEKKKTATMLLFGLPFARKLFYLFIYLVFVDFRILNLRCDICFLAFAFQSATCSIHCAVPTPPTLPTVSTTPHPNAIIFFADAFVFYH